MSVSRTIVPAALILLVPATLSAQAPARPPFAPAARPTPSWRDDPYDIVTWQLYDGAGWRAIQRGYHDTAEHEFQAAIKLAGNLAPGGDRRLLSRSYAGLATALMLQGRVAEAEPLAKWVVSAREAQGGPDSAPVASTLGLLGEVETALGHAAEAEAAFRRGLEIHARLARPDQVETARLLSSLGQLVSGQRRYAEAESLFEHAVTLRESLLGGSHPETIESVANLASAWFEQGKDDEALPLLDRALAGFEQSYGRKDAALVAPLLAIADIRGRRGEAAEAEAGYRRALAILDATDPAGGRPTIRALRRYAAWLDRTGRGAESPPLRDRAELIRRRIDDPRATLTAPGPARPPRAL